MTAKNDFDRQLRLTALLTRACRGSSSGASRTRTGGLLGAIQALASLEFALFAGHSSNVTDRDVSRIYPQFAGARGNSITRKA